MQIGIIGLGYVGISLAALFATKHDVIGFDINKQKIAEYKKGIDRTEEVGPIINTLGIEFTTKIEKLNLSDVIIIAVPTPTTNGDIDTSYVLAASKMIAPHIKQNAIVVYESTVYPFFTREECLPILELYSQKKCGKDFFIGYSPERVNPGDKTNTLENITKVVAGIDDTTTKKLVDCYSSVIHTIHPVKTLEIAESCKVLENTQRDVNIALINQFAMLFDDIDTHAVVDAMNTKWNALGFTSGLVGGHCIAEDPHYLIHKSKSRGKKFSLIEEARNINNQVPNHIVMKLMYLLNKKQKTLSASTVLVKGITFKENCPDIRNSKSVEIVKELNQYGAQVIIVDPVADIIDFKETYKMEISSHYTGEYDAIIYAVNHDAFTADVIHTEDIIIDVKGKWVDLDLEFYYSL